MDPKLRRSLYIAGGVLLAFLIGFGWQWGRAEGLEDELEATATALRFQELEATLAAAAVEAAAGSFEAARQHASRFYTGLQDAQGAPAGAADALMEMRATRDAMITALSRSSPEAADELRRLLLRWRVAFDEPVGPAPDAAPATPPAAPPETTDTGAAAPATG